MTGVQTCALPISEVLQNQDVALKVFSRLGFYKEAILKNYVLDAKGKRHDLVQMTMDIGDSLSDTGKSDKAKQ